MFFLAVTILPLIMQLQQQQQQQQQHDQVVPD
jgi:hypothetical protein